MDEKDQVMMVMMKKMRRSNNTITSSPSGALAVRKDSRLKTFSEPKIRIIHVFAPEIIKTDTANFRDLVQRLTGKPVADRNYGHKRKKSEVMVARELQPRLVVPDKPKPRKVEHFDVFRGLDSRDRPAAKEEQGGGNYLKDFVDLDDGFMCELRGFQLPSHVDASQHITLL